MIQLTCHACSKRLQVPDTAAGKQARCSCKALVKVPHSGPSHSASSVSQPNRHVNASSTTPGAGSIVSCSACGKRLKLPASWSAGKILKCPCGNPLKPGQSSNATAQPASRPAPTPIADAIPLAVAVAPTAIPVAVPYDDPFAELPTSHASSSGGYGRAPIATFRGTAPVPQVAAIHAAPNPYLARAAAELSNERPVPQQRSKPAFLNANTGIGLLMMIGAVVWFVAGLFGGIIFFYPPVLLVLGMIQFGRGLLGDSD